MILGSHFNYWAFEPASSWAMLQGCRSDPLPFGRRKNPPTKIVAEISVCKFGGWKLSYETVSTTYWISDNTSYSIQSALFTRVNPDRVTLCDAPPPGRRFLVSQYLTHYRVFSTNWESTFFWSFQRSPIYCDDESNHCDTFAVAPQLQSWKSSQVRLVKISVGVIMLTERFCPVLMLRPFKKHSANTTTQKIK